MNPRTPTPDAQPPARRSDRRAITRYAVLATIVIVVGGMFVIREFDGAEADAGALGVQQGAPAPTIGLTAPDFTLRLADTGELVHLSDYRGKTVVLNFWATWCVPCRAEMPDLQQAHDQHDDVVVLAVNAQESPAIIDRFAESLGLTLPIAMDTTGDVRGHYGVLGLPATFFIDAEGIVRGRIFGPVYGDLLPEGIASARRAGVILTADGAAADGR